MTEIRLLTVGGEGVGKTELTYRLLDREIPPNDGESYDDSYRTQFYINNKNYLIDIFDVTSSTVKSIGYSTPIVLSAKGYLLIYSITSKTSFDELSEFRNTILQANEYNHRSKYDIPIILIGNKCDLEDKRQVSFKQGQQLASSFQCPFYEVSSKSALNTLQVFETIITQVDNAVSNEKIVIKKKRQDCIIM